MTRAVIYARYSCSKQDDMSIEGQIRDCEYFAQQNGFTVVNRYADRAISGRTDNRPQFKAMIEDGKKGKYDVVICWKIDRFSRDRADSVIYKSVLRKCGIKIYYAKEAIPDDSTGILLESMLEGYAELYSVDLAQKVKRGNYDKAKNFHTLGVRVYGLTENEAHQYIIDEDKAVWVRYVFDEIIKGTAITQIVNKLNSVGQLTPRNTKFDKSSIPRMIRNEKYKGVYTYKDLIRDKNAIPPIVSAEVWAKANAVLGEKKSQRKHTVKREVPFILTGKMYCGKCADLMIGDCSIKANGRQYDYYTCSGKKNKKNGCAKKHIDKALIEEKVINGIWQWLHNTAEVENFAEIVYQSQFNKENVAEIENLKKQLKQANKQLDNIVDFIAENGTVPKFVARSKELQETIDDLKMQIDEKSYTACIIIPKELILSTMQSFAADGFPEEARAREKLVDSLVCKIILYDDKLDIYFNAPNVAPQSIDIKEEIDRENEAETGRINSCSVHQNHLIRPKLRIWL